MTAPFNPNVIPRETNPQLDWKVDPNQLVSNQITGLLSSNNPYITNARAQGSQQAASRGFLNGTMAAGASENAAVNAALPIASQDAGTYAKAGETNATNATQREMEDDRARATMGAAGISANASMFGDTTRAATSAAMLTQGANEYNANWAHDQTRNQWGVQAAYRDQGFHKQNSIMDQTLSTLYSNPDYWANPQGAAGMANFYNNTFGDIYGTGGTTYNPNDPNYAPTPGGTIPVPVYQP